MDESIKRNAIPIKTQSLEPTVSYGCCMFCGQSFAIETIGEGGNQKKT